MFKGQQHYFKKTISIGLITLFASVHLNSNTMVAAQENGYNTINQFNQSFSETSMIEPITTKVYEEIIEESGEVTPGAPGSLDDVTSTIPETTEPMVTEPPVEETESPVEETVTTTQVTETEPPITSTTQGQQPIQSETTSIITRIIRGSQTTANNVRNQGKQSTSNQPLLKESQAHSITYLFLKNYIQTNIEKYPKVRFWSYALLTMTTGQTELLNPVVVPLVVAMAEILSNY